MDVLHIFEAVPLIPMQMVLAAAQVGPMRVGAFTRVHLCAGQCNCYR